MARKLRVKPRESGIISLGRRGDHEARRIVLELADYVRLYGQGSVQALHRRKGDATPYLLTLTRSGDEAVWVPDGADTGVPGLGRLEVRWYVGGALAKSREYQTEVFPSLEDPGDTPVEVETALERLAESVSSANEAVVQAGESAQAAAAARSAAEAAAGAAETAASTAISAAGSASNSAGLAERSAGLASVAAQAAEAAQADAESARDSAEEEASAAAESATSASQSALSAAVDAGDAAEYAAQARAAKAAAQAAQATAEDKASAAAGSASDAAQAKDAAAGSAESAGASKTAAETAQEAAESAAEDAVGARQDIADSIAGVSQESTARLILGKLVLILPVLEQIAEEGSGSSAGSLNGFGLELAEDNAVILTYTNPDTGVELARERLATDIAGQDEAVQLRLINNALQDYFTTGG